MTPSAPQSRRRLLGSLGLVATAGLAGCTDEAGEPTDTESGENESATDQSSDSESADFESTAGESGDTGESADTDGTESDDLDLQEANVVDVSITEQSEAYEFAVALHHDDDGEDGYANWWQVEQLDGTQLGRRELLHAHSQQPFTRRETIEIPDAVDCVVVRGHDQTHGYGGQAMLVTLDSGATQARNQGEEPASFEGADCP